jgi:NADPH-dependent 2,4-dienoyl-CoA reductase/sulfur reductase-like enzyme
MAEKIVIVGGVAAGPKAACRIKRLNPQAEVTVIDQDSLISYGGCGIPYYVAGDVADETQLRSTSFHVVRDESFFEKYKGVKILTSTRALAIDRDQRRCAYSAWRMARKRISATTSWCWQPVRSRMSCP